MKQTRWTESTTGFERVDREAGVIRGVKILGLVSRNGYRYLREAVAKASPQYEGAKVYIDHIRLKDEAASDRRTADRWGKLVNVKLTESGELVGDLEYLKSHPLTEQILEAVEKFGDFGLSHDAGGVRKTLKGETVVESITKLYSVDLVQNPATNSNLFESVAMKQLVKKNLLAVLRENAKHPIGAKLLVRLTEMQDVYTPEMEMEMETEDGVSAPEGSAAGSELSMAFRAAVMAIVDSDKAVEDKIAKIKLLLDVQQQLSESTSRAVDEAKAAAAVEITALKEQVTALEAEKTKLLGDSAELQKTRATESCRKLLESLKREPTEARIAVLLSVSEDARKQVAETWPEAVSRPDASPSKFLESYRKGDDKPEGGTKTESLREVLGV